MSYQLIAEIVEEISFKEKLIELTAREITNLRTELNDIMGGNDRPAAPVKIEPAPTIIQPAPPPPPPPAKVALIAAQTAPAPARQHEGPMAAQLREVLKPVAKIEPEPEPEIAPEPEIQHKQKFVAKSLMDIGKGFLVNLDLADEPGEQWRKIPGAQHYEISNIGRVKSLPREKINAKNIYMTNAKILKGSAQGRNARTRIVGYTDDVGTLTTRSVPSLLKEVWPGCVERHPAGMKY